MNLYEIAAQYHDDVARLQDLDLPPEAVLDTVDGMQGDVIDKVKAMLIVAMQFEAEEEVKSGHSKRMADAGKAAGNRGRSLRSLAQHTIQTCGIALPLKFEEFTVNMQKNPASCEVVDVQELPADLKACAVTFTVRPDQAGAFVAGILKSAKLAKAVEGEPAIDFRPDKKAILDVMKKAGTDTLPGARLCPPAYRLTIR